MPPGKPREAPTPHSSRPANARGRLWPNTKKSNPTMAKTPCARTTATLPYREYPVAEPTADRHRGQEDGETEGAHDRRLLVSVDHRQADPVVAGPLGEREGQHHQPHQERARLEPPAQGTRSTARGRAVGLRDVVHGLGP